MQDKPDKQKPARDVRENPAPNPDGKEGTRKPPPETPTPPAKPDKSPSQRHKGAADRGAL